MARSYEPVAIEELVLDDRISARSLGLDDSRDLVVLEAYDEPADVEHQTVRLVLSFPGKTDFVRLGEPRSKKVERLVVESSPAAAGIVEKVNAAIGDADPETVRTSRLFGLELLSWQYRLSHNLVARAELGFRDPADPHPFDVSIDDVYTTALDAIANVLVYLRESHGETVDVEQLLAEAIAHVDAETPR